MSSVVFMLQHVYHIVGTFHKFFSICFKALGLLWHFLASIHQTQMMQTELHRLPENVPMNLTGRDDGFKSDSQYAHKNHSYTIAFC